MLGLRKRNINAKNCVNWSRGLAVIVGDTKCWTLNLKLRPQFTRSIIITFIEIFILQGLRFLKINSLHDLLLGPIQHQDELSATVHVCYLYRSMFPIWWHPRHRQVTLTIPFWVQLGQFVGRKMSNVFSVTSVVAVNKVQEQKNAKSKVKEVAFIGLAQNLNSFTILNAGWSRNMLLTSIVQALQLTRKWAAAQQGLSWVLDIPQICCL